MGVCGSKSKKEDKKDKYKDKQSKSTVSKNSQDSQGSKTKSKKTPEKSKKEKEEKKKGGLFSCGGGKKKDDDKKKGKKEEKKDKKKKKKKKGKEEEKVYPKMADDIHLSFQYIIKACLRNKEQRISRCPAQESAKYMPGLRFDQIYNHVPHHVRENFNSLPNITSINSSLVDEEEYPGYFELMNVNEWFGPYQTLDTFYITQISAKSKQSTGWILKINKTEMEIFEVANNSKKGFYRWVGGTKAHEYNHFVVPPKKVQEWKRAAGGKFELKTK